MKWEKRGLIYGPDGKYKWAQHSALQPTPILIDNKVIRTFIGFRDEHGVGRIGYVDISSRDPHKILKISKRPVLDIGAPGSFDDNGVIPCAVIRRDESLYLYYAGYHLGLKVRFCAYSGLAISNDYGESFERFSKAPILERSDRELLFRVIHSIIQEGDKWKVWYGAGNKFIHGKNKTLPQYNIKYTESEDGINFPKNGITAIDILKGEYRVGRPYVIKESGLYKMFYGIGTNERPYILGYAESKDGINWKRKDKEIGISLSPNGWDSKMIAYPAIISVDKITYMFYNGNDYGKEGFGYAILKKW